MRMSSTPTCSRSSSLDDISHPSSPSRHEGNAVCKAASPSSSRDGIRQPLSAPFRTCNDGPSMSAHETAFTCSGSGIRVPATDHRRIATTLSRSGCRRERRYAHHRPKPARFSTVCGARPGQPGTRPGMTNNQWRPASAINSAARRSPSARDNLAWIERRCAG
jgi:hypothetical protein